MTTAPDPKLVPLVRERTTGRVLYALQPKQFLCYQQTPLYRGKGRPGPVHIGYGGAAGGGKSYLARAIVTATAMKWPGSTSIIFRKTEWEVKANHVTKFWAEVPPEIGTERLYRWNGEDMSVNWTNGSRTYFGYLKDEDDVLRYQGPEYDVMVFEESTHYSETMVAWLVSNRLRATTEESEPFVVYPSNPGGKGHQWYRRLFVKRQFREEEDPKEYVFIKAKLADNFVLERRDPKYRRRLDRLPEPWRSWMRDGDFESGAGTAFSDLYEKKHIVPPFEIPAHWPRWGSMDWGFRHNTSIGEFTRNEDGLIFKRDTLKLFRHQPPDILGKARHFYGGSFDKLRYTVAGRDVWAERKAWDDYGPTMEQYFSSEGWFLRQANWDRIQGYQRLVTLFAYLRKGPEDVFGEPTEGEPDLLFMDTKGNRDAFDQIGSMTPDDTGEDVMKVDSNEFGEGGDDMYDETRYGVMDVPEAAEGQRADGHLGAWDPKVLAEEERRQRTFRGLPVRHRPDALSPEFGINP